MIYANLRGFTIQFERVTAPRFALLGSAVYSIRKKLGENVDDEIAALEKAAIWPPKGFAPHDIGIFSHDALSLLCLYHLLIA